MRKYLTAFLRDEEGLTMVEYAVAGSLITLASRTYASSAAFGAGLVPQAVAVSPDDTKLYVAINDPTKGTPDFIAVLDPHSGAPIASTITVGAGAALAGISFSPDGKTAYVVDRGTNAVSVIDTASDTVTRQISGLDSPTGIAVSPDGTKVLVANSGDHTVTMIDVSGSAATPESIAIAGPPGATLAGIAISPDGSHAYVADPSANEVTEIGNSVALTIAVAGNGLGSVTSSPSGISCGTACQARFPVGTSIARTSWSSSKSVRRYSRIRSEASPRRNWSTRRPWYSVRSAMITLKSPSAATSWRAASFVRFFSSMRSPAVICVTGLVRK